MLRKSLIYLRKQYNSNLPSFTKKIGVIFGILFLISLAIDWFLPYASLWNLLRSLILIPLSVSIYSLSYLFGLRLHYQKTEQDEDWVPYRFRFSVMWRRRIAMMIGAVLLVFIYSSSQGINPKGHNIAYTFVSSIFVACFIALFAFIRTTREEEIREELDIPDERDVSYNIGKKRRQEIRKQEEFEKKLQKKEKRDKLLGRKINDEE